MDRASAKQMIVVIGGGFVVGATLIGLLFLFDPDDAVSSDAIQRIGWVVPLAAGLVIGGMALVLLGTPDDDDADIDDLEPVSCASCGSPIIAEWRLCPHCGALLECDIAMSAGISGSSEP